MSVPFSNLLEKLRDRVVHRSQIGKRKLDRSAVGRRLDEARRILGERYLALVRAGRVEVPADLTRYADAVRGLEDELQAIDRRLEQLRSEHPGHHQPSTT